MKILIPRSKSEFEEAMRQIEAELIGKGVSIPARSLHGLSAYAKRFALEIPLGRAELRPTDEIYTGESLSAHIREWFHVRYGDRQNIFMGPGTTVVLLKGDLWEMRIPLIYGTVDCVTDPDLEKYNQELTVGVNKPPTLNILTLLNDITPAFACGLAKGELASLGQNFAQAFECFNMIEHLDKLPYAAEARADLRASVSQMMAHPPHFGQSKWASAQAAEKFVKGLLESNKIAFPRVHDLEKLLPLAAPLGLLPEAEAINYLQTAASVRYGATVTMKEALHAHHSALLVGRAVARALWSKK